MGLPGRFAHSEQKMSDFKKRSSGQYLGLSRETGLQEFLQSINLVLEI